MSSSICTLFEGHYHYGLAAFVNSLHQYGFRGPVFAGYKGNLPDWCKDAPQNASLNWPGATTYTVAPGLSIHFLPLETEFHLTNYKPYYMIRLLEGLAKDYNSLAYFDPDIVIKCKWSFFENWMEHGVGLVHEIIANDMPPTHPLRKEWEKLIHLNGREVTHQLYSYINGGFCGVSKANVEFLHTWRDIFDVGIKHAQLTPGQWRHSYDRTYIFYAQDQDAMNIAAMCCNSPISEMGPEAMDFINGGTTMSHSAGSTKPWRKQFFKSAFNGIPPNRVDKLYWAVCNQPIACYTNRYLKRKRLALRIAALIGRFYKRN